MLWLRSRQIRLGSLFNNQERAVTAPNLLARRIPAHSSMRNVGLKGDKVSPEPLRRHPRTFPGVLWDVRKKKRLQKQARRNYTLIDILAVTAAVVQILTRVYVA